MSELENTKSDETLEVTDEQLAELGLKKRVAYVKDGSAKTAAARRKEKSREKQKEAGLEQVTVAAAEPVRQIVKQLAERTKAGEDLNAVLASLVPVVPVPVPVPQQVLERVVQKLTDEQERLIELGRRADTLKGWKGLLVTLLLGSSQKTENRAR